MSSLNTIEKIGYTLVLGVTIAGAITALISEELFMSYFTVEDGLVETLTAVFLLTAGFMMAWRAFSLRSGKSAWFIITSLFIALLFVFVGGEELSWGQRIFEVESSEFFKENNSQAETNLHNLVVGDVKLNKLIFGKILTAGLFIYTLLFPLFYRRSEIFRKWINYFYIPVPKMHQSAVFVISSLIIALLDVSRKWEVLEFCTSIVFFLVLFSPLNSDIYKTSEND